MDGPIQVSFLFRYNATNQNNNAFAAIILSDGNITNANNTSRPSIGLKANDGDGNPVSNDLFVRFSLGGESYVSLNITTGTEYLLTGLLSKTGTSTTYNRFDLTVTDGINTYTSFVTGNSGLSKIDRLGIRSANLSTDAVSIDNLNVNVVPVPPALALVAMGVGPLAGWHFLRRRKTFAA
jgi:hypothetical protein